MTVKPTVHLTNSDKHYIQFFSHYVNFLFIFLPFLHLCLHDVKWSLRAALLSLCCPDMVNGVGQIPSAQGHFQDGDYRRVKESRVNVVSILVCLKEK